MGQLFARLKRRKEKEVREQQLLAAWDEGRLGSRQRLPGDDGAVDVGKDVAHEGVRFDRSVQGFVAFQVLFLKLLKQLPK